MITTPSTSNHFSIRNHNQPDFDKSAVSQIAEIYKDDEERNLRKRLRDISIRLDRLEAINGT